MSDDAKDDDNRREPPHDPETGEVHDDGRGWPLPCVDCGAMIASEAEGDAHRCTPRRQRRTPEEQEEARRVREERKAQRARMLAALDALSPALVAPGDPPLRETGTALADVSRAREVRELFRLPRLSGTGGPGSALVGTARPYDGGNGGEAGPYALVYAEFSDAQGFRCRTRGVAIRRPGLRPVAAALLAYADELDARDAARGTS
jgi:hypothetical protein